MGIEESEGALRVMTTGRGYGAERTARAARKSEVALGMISHCSPVMTSSFSMRRMRDLGRRRTYQSGTLAPGHVGHLIKELRVDEVLKWKLSLFKAGSAFAYTEKRMSRRAGQSAVVLLFWGRS